uniref:Uncharacterized protein n=1 Tax=Podarcis muralis TaxID=64176 RepID=A0A670HZP5_PODMU
MKLDIFFPATGCQKLIEVDDEHKLRTFCKKCMTAEVSGCSWRGAHVLKQEYCSKEAVYPKEQPSG